MAAPYCGMRVARYGRARAASSNTCRVQEALSRPPTAEERTLGVKTLTQLAAAWKNYAQTQEAQIDAHQQALATYCHTIMNSAALLYVD